MERKSSMDGESGWVILICAHDHVWSNHGWSVRERMAATQLLWELAIKVCAGPEALSEASA
jgi:hypothetical protein